MFEEDDNIIHFFSNMLEFFKKYLISIDYFNLVDDYLHDA